MNDQLSIIKPQEDVDFSTSRAESATANAALAVKTALAYVPGVGPILSEVVGVMIPNYKQERLIAFAQVLGDRVKHLEADTLEAKMKTEEFADLLEDALRQAARALTPERREYIASLLKNSLTHDELAHVEEKKLLSLLGELNDAEIIILKYYSLSPLVRRDFAEIHSELFEPIKRNIGAPQSNIDRAALRDSYRGKLFEVNLLESAYKKPSKNEMPEFDEKTGRLKASSLKVTPLGKLLLRYIDQNDDVVVEEAEEASSEVA